MGPLVPQRPPSSVNTKQHRPCWRPLNSNQARRRSDWLVKHGTPRAALDIGEQEGVLIQGGADSWGEVRTRSRCSRSGDRIRTLIILANRIQHICSNRSAATRTRGGVGSWPGPAEQRLAGRKIMKSVRIDTTG